MINETWILICKQKIWIIVSCCLRSTSFDHLSDVNNPVISQARGFNIIDNSNSIRLHPYFYLQWLNLDISIAFVIIDQNSQLWKFFFMLFEKHETILTTPFYRKCSDPS